MNTRLSHRIPGFIQDGSDGGGDDDGARGGDGAHVSGLEERMSPYLRPVPARGAWQRPVPWSEASCCECAVLQPESGGDGETRRQQVCHDICKNFPLLCFCPFPPTSLYFLGTKGW